jgi:hypothetical protein
VRERRLIDCATAGLGAHREEDAMHRIEPKPYGFKIAYEGFLRADDIARFSDEMRRNVATMNGEFAVLVDLRETRTFPPDAQAELMKIIGYCHEQGMNRNVIVVNSAITKIQANRLAREGGVTDIRFIDAAHTSDWEQVAEDWLIRGKEPAATTAPQPG